MALRSRTRKALSILLPVGVLGASALLASAQAKAISSSESPSTKSEPVSTGVAERLQQIRESAPTPGVLATLDISADEKILLAQWVNIGAGGGGLGWRNGGWGNGGWRNAGWRNAGWGNGGWHNWNNGWRNWGNGGWHNFWHNW